MNTKYKIRTATKDDREKIQHLFIRSVACEKNIFSHELVSSSFIDDFVNKVIDEGNMIVIENHASHVEMIGEVHYYNPSAGRDDTCLKELVFFSWKEEEHEEEHELIEWLYGEIEQKHSDVFSVGISAPVSSLHSILMYQKKGITVEGNYLGRMNKNCRQKIMLPLKWINPSFN
jgi:hypothetical protein